MTAKVEESKKKGAILLNIFGKAKDVVSSMITSAYAIATHSALEDAQKVVSEAKKFVDAKVSTIGTQVQSVVGPEESREKAKDILAVGKVREVLFQKTLDAFGWSKEDYLTIMEDKQIIQSQPKEESVSESETERLKNRKDDFHSSSDRSKDNMKDAGKDILGLLEYVPAIAAIPINPTLAASIAIVITGIKVAGYYKNGKKLNAEHGRRGSEYANEILPIAEKIEKFETMINSKIEELVPKYRKRENDEEFIKEINDLIISSAQEVGLEISIAQKNPNKSKEMVENIPAKD